MVQASGCFFAASNAAAQMRALFFAVAASATLLSSEAATLDFSSKERPVQKVWAENKKYTYQSYFMFVLRARSRLCQRRSLRPNIYFLAFFKIYSRAYRAKKKCTHFSSPEKKNTFGGELRLGRPSRQRRAPGGYQRLTLGQRSVNVRYLP